MAYKLGLQTVTADNIEDGAIPYSKLSQAAHLTIDAKAEQSALDTEIAARVAKDSSLDTDVAGLSTIIGTKADQTALTTAQNTLQFNIDTLAGQTYSKAHINNQLGLKASQAAFNTHVADTYSKGDVDTKLALKADASSIGDKLTITSTDNAHPGGKRFLIDGNAIKIGRFALLAGAVTSGEIRNNTIKPVNLHADTLTRIGDGLKAVATDNTANPGGYKLVIGSTEKKIGRWGIFDNAVTSLEIRDGTVLPSNMHADTLARMPVIDSIVIPVSNGAGNGSFDTVLTASRIGNVVTVFGITRTVTLGATFATIPVGWRPPHRVYSPCVRKTGSHYADIGSDGSIQSGGSGVVDWIMMHSTFIIA